MQGGIFIQSGTITLFFGFIYGLMFSPFEYRHCKDNCETQVITSILRLLVVFVPIGVIFMYMRMFYGNEIYTSWLLVI